MLSAAGPGDGRAAADSEPEQPTQVSSGRVAAAWHGAAAAECRGAARRCGLLLRPRAGVGWSWAGWWWLQEPVAPPPPALYTTVSIHQQQEATTNKCWAPAENQRMSEYEELKMS